MLFSFLLVMRFYIRICRQESLHSLSDSMFSDFLKTALLHLRPLCILLIFFSSREPSGCIQKYDEDDHCRHRRRQAVITALLQIKDRKTDRLRSGTRKHGGQRQLREG